MKKIDGYPHNGYLTDMGTGTGRIFIQRVGYEGTTTRTLPAPLTSLLTSLFNTLVLRKAKFKFSVLFELFLVLCYWSLMGWHLVFDFMNVNCSCYWVVYIMNNLLFETIRLRFQWNSWIETYEIMLTIDLDEWKIWVFMLNLKIGCSLSE